MDTTIEAFNECLNIKEPQRNLFKNLKMKDMYFANQRITPIITQDHHVWAMTRIKNLKNAQYGNGFLIQEFSDTEISTFRMYWDLVRSIFNAPCIELGDHQLIWHGLKGSEQYVFELDSKTGHKMLISFTPSTKKYLVSYCHNINNPETTEQVVGKIVNLISSLKVKALITQFQS